MNKIGGGIMFELFHVKRGKETWGWDPTPHFPEDYDFIARVEAEELEDVFALTNHIEWNWMDNSGVFPIVKEARSTSVGDVVKDLRTGEYFLCERIGWKKFRFPELTREELEKVTEKILEEIGIIKKEENKVK